MKKFYSLLAALLCIGGVIAQAQNIVSSSPAPLQENSENVVITYYADQGNLGLMGLGSGVAVYAHTGVITNKSGGAWAYAPKWLDNSTKYKLTYIAPNKYELTIGDIREYYGITDPNEEVQQLAFVFRTYDGSREGKTATGGDIFLDVLPAGFQLDFSSDAPKILTNATATVNFTLASTATADLSIYLDSTTGTPIATATGAKILTKAYTFAEGEDHTVIAVGKHGSETMTKEIPICYPGNSTEAPYPGGGTPAMGAVAQTDGSVVFCLGAPEKHNAMIIGAWNDYKATTASVMHYTDDNGIRYFWTQVSGLDPDTEYPYYYIIDGATTVGDPYARLILDPYNDKWLSDGQYPGLMPYPTQVDEKVMLAVYKGTRDNYDWQIKNFRGVDQSELIIYEMLLRDFTGTEGKAYGDGTLRQAMDKLDYLETLGINAIELMPIQDFNGNNSWGYNTNFYFAPDKAYGSPDDYRAFIDECHRRGIAVILDVVFNQSDGEHPWYKMYAAASNPFYNERAPHAYSVLNDWKQDNLLVQQQWTDMITYWMTAYKVDGFRFDLVKGLGDNASYGGNASETNTNNYNASRIARMKRLTEVIRAINPNGYSINENLAGAAEENAMAANGQLNWANINNEACQFAMGYEEESNCNRFYAPRDSRTWGSTVSYAESHDEQRMAYKQDQWGATGIKGYLGNSMRRLGSVAAQMLLSPGAHMIWQFGELGNATNTKNADWSNNTDPKPVYWSYLDNPDRHGLYDNYCQLIDIRRSNPDLFTEAATFTINCNSTNWALGRTIYASTADKELVCVINPNTTTATMTGVQFMSKNKDDYKVMSSSYDVDYTFDPATGKVTLQPGSYVVIANSNVTAIDDPQSDGEARVHGADGRIVITGAYDCAKVYSVSGREMGRLDVTPGIYVVVVDGTAYKVVVSD